MKYKLIIAVFGLCTLLNSCVSATGKKTDPPQLSQQEIFINEKLKSMTIEEMIGQLIMIGSDANNKQSYYKNIIKSIDSLKIGGVCFFKGTSEELMALNKKYSTVAKNPLLVSIDGEWGLAMRLTDAYSFPAQITLGATDNDSLIYEMGKNIALQAKSLGIHINFAPTIDINLNPKNPVIGFRSFGEDKKRVAKLGWAYLKGMQDNGALGSLKHFPGHGDTETDSHYSLPIINHSKAFIDSIDSYPFRYAIDKGAKMVMVGHLNIPSLIPDKKLPSSLSKEIITDYLKKELGFKGIVITDALNMKGVTNEYLNGEAEVLALIAGVDILLMPKDEYKAVSAILKAIKDNRITQKDIKNKCRKVLNLKYEMGLFDNEIKELSIPKEEIIEQAQTITNQLSESIITLAKNDSNFLPIINRHNSKIALVQLGSSDHKTFISTLKDYSELSIFRVKNINQLTEIEGDLKKFDYVIATIGGNIRRGHKSNYGIDPIALKVLTALQKNQKTILALFANPYSIQLIEDMKEIKAILIGYENTPSLQRALANSIFGKIHVKGKLPVSSSEKYKVNFGLRFDDEAMSYVNCNDANMNPQYFMKIDSIVNYGIVNKAYPGCQIVVYRDNKLVYNKSYGYLTYDSLQKVNNNTLYDVASVTKVMSTTISMMKLYDESNYQLDEKLSKYMPILDSSNKNEITFREILSHNTGMKAWEPFYSSTIINNVLDTSIYKTNKTNSKDYVPVCDSLYITKSYKNSIVDRIIKSELNKEKGYVYSDFGFILLGEFIEKNTNMPLEKYVDESFYKPMRLRHIGYNPLKRFSINNIAPTEIDNYFRNRLIRGYVHDPAAAMFGGVAGHAGLFSNAKDIAELCQMLLNGGKYSNQRYIKENTIRIFNKTYFKDNRRTLGFDKPVDKKDGNNSPCSQYASKESFGHTGFTGTYFWVEPKENLTFVFLSNRVFPSQNNNKLSKLSIRTNIHDLLYESIRNY
ncbi:MAG: glycoside hydrolase family 3 N-terminal domain-containing protein [Bacteroidales bacterium]|jgi:beta-glucosidase-like glycosyl hydrolase/CubicO group peptidase (beta-lactamase class C family)|nr:glycoside hydrolase family 3 N-terminal domain-containing protein [Bacteroidales bacterium]